MGFQATNKLFKKYNNIKCITVMAGYYFDIYVGKS